MFQIQIKRYLNFCLSFWQHKTIYKSLLDPKRNLYFEAKSCTWSRSLYIYKLKSSYSNIKHSKEKQSVVETEKLMDRMKRFCSNASLILLVSLILTSSFESEAQKCRPSGRIRGKKAPAGECNQENDSDCCIEGKLYTTYECSPPMSTHTKAYLTLNSFEKGGDGGGPSECDNQYHSDDTVGFLF